MRAPFKPRLDYEVSVPAFRIDAQIDDYEQAIERFSEENRQLIDCVNKFLKMSISGGVGSPVQKVYDWHDSYDGAIAAIGYKFYTGKNAILQIDDFRMNKGNLEFHKLYETENKLVAGMKMGNREEASALVAEVFRTLCGNRQLPVDYVQSI